MYINATRYKLQLQLQVQFFKLNKVKTRFGFYSDCEYFFDVGSWTGLLTIAMIIAVVLIGVDLLFTIKIGDRFENPHGKGAVMGVKGTSE